MSAFDRKEIKYSGGDEHWTRIHHQEQSRMIHTVRNHAVEILFGIAVGIGEDPVIDSHGQCRDVARWRGNFNPFIQGCDMCSLKAATTRTRNIDALRIHLRTSE